MAASSFSYKQIFPGNAVMVFIPHEDDEINVAGATIYGLRQEGFRVICVFATNGDRSYLAKTRIKEAVDALGILGVLEEDVIFLGYPDGGLDAARSVFMHGKEHAITVNGRSETYGIEGKPEFCMAVNGYHRPYTWNGFLDDIHDLLLKYTPDTIMGIDFDSNPDHRMCSMGLEMMIGDILNREGNTYFPLVLKALAYNTAFESVKDFYADNLFSTALNKKMLMDPAFETDNPVYEWNKRVRLPVPKDCRVSLLWDNIIFHALRCHLSQRAMLRAIRIINSDQVFWVRRTDNLVFQGRIEVSSGRSEYLHDFCMMKTNDVRPKHGVVMEDYLWVPDAEDHEKYCQCTFTEPQHIESISLYGNIDQEGHILKGRLIFSNGYTCEVEELKKDGHETQVEFSPQDQVTWVKFQILETKGIQAGLSEWEIFSHKETAIKLLHILADENLAYDWLKYPGKSGPEISAYTYGIKSEVRWFLDGKEKTLNEINKICRNVKKSCIIRVEMANDPMVWNEMSVKPVSKVQAKKRALQVAVDQLHLWIEKQRIKPEHHRLRKLKRDSMKGKL